MQAGLDITHGAALPPVSVEAGKEVIAEVTAWFLMKMSFFMPREVVSQELGLVLIAVGRIMQYHSIRK